MQKKITTLFAIMFKAGVTEVRLDNNLLVEFIAFRMNSRDSLIIDNPVFMGIKILNFEKHD